MYATKMRCCWGIKVPGNSLIRCRGSGSVLVKHFNQLAQLFACLNEISTIIRSDFSGKTPQIGHSVKGIQEQIHIKTISNLQMNCSRRETGKPTQVTFLPPCSSALHGDKRAFDNYCRLGKCSQ